jgi:hypothetical protein
MFLTAAVAWAQSPYFQGTFDETLARAKAEGKAVLLFFDYHY